MARTQATSVGEASTAVSQMEAVTQQNAALVEEATAAATSLERQADDLRVVVHRFQVNDPEPARV
jgi:methyl-accepting chemotaxis protein